MGEFGLAGPLKSSLAILELRRLSGLTFEQLAKLFKVENRRMHLWASGKPMSATKRGRLQAMLAAIHKADRGTATKNRAMLLKERRGVIPFDLLAKRKFDQFAQVVGDGPGRHQLRSPKLSSKAKAARRPTPPEDLVDAKQDRVATRPHRARPGHAPKIKL